MHITIDGRDVFDDARYNGDATPSSGSLGLDPDTGLLTWTGDLAVGASVVTTGSVTVDNPLDPGGNRHLRTRIATTDVPSNCPPASTDPECLIDVPVLTPGLSIVTTANRTTATPGATVGYTLTIANTGETAYTGATVADDLSGVLDDATYNADVSSGGVGTVSVIGSTLTWSGDLAVGAGPVTVTFSVRVQAPDNGDLNLVDAVTSEDLGSSCASADPGPTCSSMVTVLIPALDVSVAADSTTAYPGAVVTYTVTVTNSGQADYAGASVSIALGGVLDDAIYNADAAVATGAVGYLAPNLTWTGDLAVGHSESITYSVTVRDPDPGNRSLLTSVSSPAPGSTCPPDNPCTSTVTVQVPALSVSITADSATTTPGDRVTFTIRLNNTGQRIYLGTTTTASLAGVLDDATFNGQVASSSGVATYSAPNVSWTGTLLPGQQATIVYSVRVREPDTGDHRLAASVTNDAAGSTCRPGSDSSLCAADVAVLVPALAVSVVAGAPTTTPGGLVTFTVLIANTGETPYTGARVTSSLNGLLTDADYAGDAHVTTGGGSLGYADGQLRWTGDLAVGASATVTYSVTVHDPVTGDKQLVATVVSTAPGSTCPTAGTTGCSATVQVRVPGLTVRLSAAPATVTAGGQVAYTLRLLNSGETDYVGATAAVSLADVLDDATFDPAGVVVGAGTVTYADQTLTWSGSLAQGDEATVTFSVTTNLPSTGDQSLDAAVVAPEVGSNCPGGSTDALCSVTTVVKVPELRITKTASATHVVAGQSLSYTVTATNTGEADYAAAALTDDLSAVLDHAGYNEDATATSGGVSLENGVLTWSGPLAIGASVVLSYSVTVTPAQVDSVFVLSNRVFSPSPGATCVDGGNNPLCTTSTTVDAGTLELSGLSSSFTLTGQPGDTVSLDDAVVGTVVTNSLSGYSVTVQAEDDQLRGSSPGNTDTIPIDLLEVRANGTSAWTPLSATTATRVGGSDSASAPGGDAVSNDAQIQIPDVSSDTYSGTLDYVVATQ